MSILINRTQLWLLMFLMSPSVILTAHENEAAGSPQAGRTRESRDRSAIRWQNEVSITIERDLRIIRGNGLPDHLTGRFPRRGNPHRIAAQKYEFRMTMAPRANTLTTPNLMNPFGIAVNGVVFDPWAEEFWRRDRSSGWRYEALSDAVNLGEDTNNAHVQPNGAYHYHGLPTGLLDMLTGGSPKMILVGWAADGFPIYGPWAYSDPNNQASPIKESTSSYQLKTGNRKGGPNGAHDGSFVQDYDYIPEAGDLDECNGHIGMTPEHPEGIYHYHLTDGFPFIPRQWKGTPDSSFLIRRGPAERIARNRNSPPPRRRQRNPGNSDSTHPILKALDVNDDQELDAEELAGATDALLKLDENGDGKLSPEEYQPTRPAGRAARP
ncbi:MAG TPA: YHYH protein [Verrucomicrobiales bacterium]|nr:YHYH protein [Verrucomicrobiales bacterium]